MISEYDPVYLDRDVCRALKAWPELPPPEITEKLMSAAILHKGGLTGLGQAFVPWVANRDFAAAETTMTFFRLETVLQCWPLEMLSDRYPPISDFLGLFSIDFNTPDVRRYISKNMGTSARKKHGFWDRPGDATAPASRRPSLLELMADLGAAIDDNLLGRK